LIVSQLRLIQDAQVLFLSFHSHKEELMKVKRHLFLILTKP